MLFCCTYLIYRSGNALGVSSTDGGCEYLKVKPLQNDWLIRQFEKLPDFV